MVAFTIDIDDLFYFIVVRKIPVKIKGNFFFEITMMIHLNRTLLFNHTKFGLKRPAISLNCSQTLFPPMPFNNSIYLTKYFRT